MGDKDNECLHTITQNDHCIKCGEHVFETESRPCIDCKSYQMFACGWPHCNKKLMTLTRTMRVYYAIKEGTCFEVKEAEIL